MNKLLPLLISITTLATPLQAEDLLQVTRYALEQDQQLKISRLGMEIKWQQQQQAQAALLPSISSNATYDLNDSSRFSGENRGESYGLSLTQKLYHRDSHKKLQQSQVLTEESELALQLTLQQLLLRVATSYFDQLAAEDSLRLAVQEKSAVGEQLKQVQSHFNVGTSSMTDVQEVQARFDLVNAQRVSAKAAVENSREALYEIIHRDLSPLQPLTDAVPLLQPVPNEVQQWVGQALENSLTLRQLRKQVTSSKLSTEIAKSGYYPTLDLVGQFSRSENSNGNYGADNDSYSVGLQATLPLYTGGYTRAKVSEAMLLQQQSETELERQKRSAVKTVRSDFLAVNTAIELVKAQTQALSSAQTAFNAIQSGVEVGTRTTVDLLDAQKELYSAHRDLTQARYNLLLARLSLKYAAGILALSDIEAVNQLLY